MISKTPISLWDSSSQETDFQQDFDGEQAVDVAIVGGGFTGLSTALHCAERGLSAHVLEAHQIGFGGSGRNVGLVNASAWLPPQIIRKQLGETYGARFVEQFGRAPEYVFSLIEKHQMRCEATRNGTIHAAHAPSGFKELQERKAEWDRLGAPVDLLSREEVSKLIGSDAFYGGLVDHRAGTINPMAYCRGLARAARGAGAQISTGVRAQKITRDDKHWRVDTSRGALAARAVVLGTNAYSDDLWPGLSKTYTMLHYFQLATRPLGPDAAYILPERQGLWDTGRIMFSLRRDASDRIVIGSMGKVIGSHERGLSRRWAQKQLARIYPALGAVEFEDAWHGQIAMTSDHLPHIHKLGENIYTPIGYNGRGITTGTIFGKAISDLLSGVDDNDLPLPISDVKSVPSAPVMSQVYQAAFTANQFIRSF
ncbi:MAG: FAD-binding oxidoreductase [Pseudomonadota bacterium]